MADAFAKKGLDSPRLMAELLMSHVIGCDRLRLYMDADRPASPLERESLRSLVARALTCEPVQYLTGEAWFHGLPYHVDRRVLIPRPATETIVSHVLHHARADPAFARDALIADICTGSGCIAVALLRGLPGARVVATDISAAALGVAARNAGRHAVGDRLDIVQGDMLSALDDHPVARGRGSLHYLVSNPPYIPDHEWPAVAPNVKNHEPESALRGGADGLEYVRRVLDSGPAFLRPGGVLAVEVADSAAAAAESLARAQPMLTGVMTLKDFEGLPRVIVGRRD